ncbi:hypothetical protein PsYK624_058270 [Phanerochaete sordida]|uniref:Uncharacterized protein n=1 Tax=Phanerochaete sordida TaxID=48140 RepID=A0A9P3G7H2_9APHY|nr:hypothetical protein PsYK624_058270 [Phanerochaete sordida]
MSLVLDVLFFAAAALFSLFLRCQIAKHKLSIRRIALLELALYDVHYAGTLYEGTYQFDFNASCVYIRFHWPRRPNPKWMTFTAKDVLYKSSTADLSTSTLSTEAWFFPKLFGQTAGPWLNVTLADFRIRVFGSDRTPYCVKRLRANLVGAVLDGEVLQCDDFGSSIRFAGITESAVESERDPDGDGVDEHPERSSGTVPQDGPYEEHVAQAKVNGAAHDSLADNDGHIKTIRHPMKELHPVSSIGREQDEVRISAYARGLALNSEGRVYRFETVDAQLRRNWTANRGSFVMIARESRWVKVPWSYEIQATTSFWTQLLSSVLQFPFDLVHVFNYPMSTVNLYIPRADITFDNFRIRDAELIPQSISLVEEKLVKSNVEWQDLFTDVLANVMIGYCRCKAC